MAPLELNALIAALPEHENGWGPPASVESALNEVPYAPYSKGDKLGRMADWTSEGGKDGRDQRGGRQGYNRNYRGKYFLQYLRCADTNNMAQISKYTEPEHQVYSLINMLKTRPPSP